MYRTLTFLKEHGLIKARYYDQAKHREVFEPTPNTEHDHFTCTHCGKVIEFQSKHVPALRAQLQGEFGVEVARAGFCARFARVHGPESRARPTHPLCGDSGGDSPGDAVVEVDVVYDGLVGVGVV